MKITEQWYKDRIKELEGVLDAWHTVFGTTQLTHAQARLEEAEKQVEKLTRKFAAIREEIDSALPMVEERADLCNCFTPDEFLDKSLNLIMCKICGKQVGEKTWNACIKANEEALDRVFQGKG